MHDFIRKLWNSKATIAVILWIAVFAWAYNSNLTKKPTVQRLPTGKTIEEIMAAPVDNSPPQPWDTEFKSNVEAAE
jgi:hypothetical protein